MRSLVLSRGLGDVYERQMQRRPEAESAAAAAHDELRIADADRLRLAKFRAQLADAARRAAEAEHAGQADQRAQLADAERRVAVACLS